MGRARKSTEGCMWHRKSMGVPTGSTLSSNGHGDATRYLYTSISEWRVETENFQLHDGRSARSSVFEFNMLK